ncbi:MAG TPA: hypothetical protein VKB03_04090 [Conexibacter sp.]|nr:hypothetical protein [Conexibacter sp.]
MHVSFRHPTEEHENVDRKRRRTVAIGAAVALAVAGGGVAYGAASGTDQRDALLRDAAGRLNVSPGELRSALEGAFGDQLDQAVKDGKLTQQQADQIKQHVKQDGLPLGGPGGPGGPGTMGPMGGPGHGPFDAGLTAAADYVGLTRAALARQLQSGKSLADVARAQGKSVDGLEQALVDEAKTRLDRDVADRKLTSDQRDQILREVQEHVADLVNGRAPGPLGRHDGRGRSAGPGGPPPWGVPPRTP